MPSTRRRNVSAMSSSSPSGMAISSPGGGAAGRARPPGPRIRRRASSASSWMSLRRSSAGLGGRTLEDLVLAPFLSPFLSAAIGLFVAATGDMGLGGDLDARNARPDRAQHRLDGVEAVAQLGVGGAQ